MAGAVSLRDEFMERVGPLGRAVASVTAAYARTPADRRDLSQEIMAQLWRTFPRYDRSRPFSTWLYRIALNVAISHARARRRIDDRHEPVEAAGGEAAEAAAPRDDRLELLHRFIAELGALDRALVTLHLDDRGHREIAEVLGISESNVSTRLTRIRQRLRERFTNEGGHDGAR
jgi:RNA polymerase sigma-70 factor (ECF subfamily)